MARRDRDRRTTNDNLFGRVAYSRHRRLRLEPLETRRLLDAGRLYVDADSPAADPDGTAWSAAYVYLQAALDQAATLNADLDDTNDISAIWIADGLYTPTKDKHNNATPDDPRTVTFSMLSGVSLYGAFAGNEETLDDRAKTPEDTWLNETILSGDLDHDGNSVYNAYTVVYGFELPEPLTLDGLTMSDGHSDGVYDLSNPEWAYGGGLFVTSSHLTISNSTLSKNRGRGVWTEGGSLAVIDSSITENWGGISSEGGTLTVTDSIISHSNGSGIYSDGGPLTVVGSTISENRGHGISNRNGTLTVTGSTINRNSTDDFRGAGIRSRESTVTITDSTFVGNSFDGENGRGGAIYQDANSTLTVIRSTFRGNTATYGGAIYGGISGTLAVSGSTFSENTAEYGGGIYSDDSGTLNVANSTFTGNGGLEDGGGIFCDKSVTAIVTTSSFSGNSTPHGGGAIYSNTGGTLTVIQSTIVGNRGSNYGGGIFSRSESTILMNSIVARNYARSYSDIRHYGDLSVQNSLIGDPDGADGVVHGQDGNLVGVNPLFMRNPSDGGDGWGDSAYSADVDESANDDYGDLRLLPGSPAVDAGNVSLLPSDTADLDGDGNVAEPIPVDLRGDSRIVGVTVDMGAHESRDDPGGRETPSTVVTTEANLVDLYDGQISLREAIYYAGRDGLGTDITFNASLANATISLGAELLWIDKSLTINASSLPSLTIDGSVWVSSPMPVLGTTWVFIIGGADSIEVRLIGLTLTRAHVTNSSDSSLTVADSTLSHSRISSEGGELTVTSSTFSGRWGGIESVGGTVTVNDSTFNECDRGAIRIENGSATITGSMFTGNYVQNSSWRNGSAVYGSGAILTIANSTFIKNSARAQGGAIYSGEGTLTVTNSTLTGNSVSGSQDSFGGGIYSTGTLTVVDSTLEGNSASGVVTAYGGGIHSTGTLTVTNSRFEGNSATVHTTQSRVSSKAHGGAIYSHGTLTVTNSLLTRNWTVAENYGYKGSERAYGGGIFADSGTLTVVGSSFTGNSVIGEMARGGGVYNWGSELTVVNSTISGNSAGSDGGGVRSGGTPTVTNSIVAMNDGEDFTGTLSDESSNNLIGVDPMFLRVASDGGDGWGDDPDTPDVDEGANDDYGDLRLKAESPAIDAGDNALVPEGVLADLNGTPRILDGDDDGVATVDIGAYEYRDTQLLLPGDANLDGVTDLSDFNIWNANKFTADTTWATADFNGDGVTDLSDFNIWNAYKFTSAPQPAPVVCEPTVDDRLWADPAWLDELADRQVGTQGIDDVARQNIRALLATYWQ